LEFLSLESQKFKQVKSLSELVKLQELNLNFSSVESLEGLETLAELRKLELWGTKITDLSPLRDLVNLESLCLEATVVEDMTPLIGLRNLKELYVSNARYVDITPVLESLPDLQKLIDVDVIDRQELDAMREIRKEGSKLAEMLERSTSCENKDAVQEQMSRVSVMLENFRKTCDTCMKTKAPAYKAVYAAEDLLELCEREVNNNGSTHIQDQAQKQSAIESELFDSYSTTDPTDYATEQEQSNQPHGNTHSRDQASTTIMLEPSELHNKTGGQEEGSIESQQATARLTRNLKGSTPEILVQPPSADDVGSLVSQTPNAHTSKTLSDDTANSLMRSQTSKGAAQARPINNAAKGKEEKPSRPAWIANLLYFVVAIIVGGLVYFFVIRKNT
jgi:hypothetical protein